MSCSNYRRQELEDSVRLMCFLTSKDVSSLLDGAKKREYAPVDISVANEPRISRADVVINAVHSRVPLSKVQNSENWEKGFEAGFPYWEKGEKARKSGDFTLAVELFDKARLNGYVAPALYNSYALTYRQLKDYSNEIVILDEGISRIPEHSSTWNARRDKAIRLLFVQQESERKLTEKAKEKVEKIAQKEAVLSTPKQPRSRAVLQMDDNGNIIKEFATISAAAQEAGVSSKSIRDAANGVQKRAGGYHWMYKK